MLNTAMLAESAMSAIGRISAPCQDQMSIINTTPQASCASKLVGGGESGMSLMVGFMVVTSADEASNYLAFAKAASLASMSAILVCFSAADILASDSNFM